MNIVTNSELQSNIGKISRDIDNDYFLVSNRGKSKMVILPYFDESDDLISDYMEDYFLFKNKHKLKLEAEKSIDSGVSNLEI